MNKHATSPRFHATTILTVRHKGTVSLGGDGQVTLGDTVIKSDATKIRRLMGDQVMVGFAGSSADSFALLERFEAKLDEAQGQIPRAATELAKDWRTDKVLRQLEALMLVVDAKYTLLLSGQGDVIQPNDGIAGIGSGGAYAVSAARALIRHSKLSSKKIVEESLNIAAEIDIYTNHAIQVEELACEI